MFDVEIVPKMAMTRVVLGQIGISTQSDLRSQILRVNVEFSTKDFFESRGHFRTYFSTVFYTSTYI